MAGRKFLLSVQALEQRLSDPGWRIVDCRFDLTRPDKGFDDYRAGHIPGAVYAHLDRDLAGPPGPDTGRHPLPAARAFAETLGRWGIDNDTRVVAYDGGGGAIAARLWWLLRWAGHADVAILDGGIEAWKRAELPLSREEPRVAPRTFRVRPNDRMVVTTAEVHQAILSGQPMRILDARAAPRYRGETEPIDRVAGHVPGARNLPNDSSLTGQGTWREPAELEALWREALGDRAAPWVAMCGSGVTACHLALSAEEAGFAAARVYIGSWSEWIRDPARPVAVGPAEGF
jgi:thiosulfate/3-mercaptopyruvate sulfurtransferase